MRPRCLCFKIQTPKQKEWLYKAGKELINCLCECGRNILKGTVPISKSHIRDLKRYKRHLRCIDRLRKKVSLHRTKKEVTPNQLPVVMMNRRQ